MRAWHVVVGAVALTSTVVTPPPAGRLDCVAPWIQYQAPVRGPIVDGFRMDHGPFGAGNRGVDFRATAGEPVRSIGPGTVAFAGLVAGALWVTVDHPDGLRSSYGALAELAAAAGDEVVRSDILGTALDHVHLGVRRDGQYLDPAPLIAGVFEVRLVPDARFDAAWC
jgi:murein DD-endopeptidase MepM/ murein hydrolase activator NlpD